MLSCKYVLKYIFYLYNIYEFKKLKLQNVAIYSMTEKPKTLKQNLNGQFSSLLVP